MTISVVDVFHHVDAVQVEPSGLVSVTLPNGAPQAGDLLRCAFWANNLSITWTPLNGFVEDSRISARAHTNAIFSKIADGTEGATFDVLRNDTGNFRQTAMYFERCTGADAANRVLASANANSGTISTTMPTGTTATLTADGQAFASWGLHPVDAAATNTWVSAGGDYVLRPGTVGRLGVANKDVLAGTTTGSTATYTDDAKATGQVVVFGEAAVPTTSRVWLGASAERTWLGVSAKSVHGTGTPRA